MFRTFVKVRHASVLADPYPSAMTLPPTPTQDCLSDVGVADVALSAFVAPSAVFPSSEGSRQCQGHWLSVHRWHYPFMPPVANHTKSDMKCGGKTYFAQKTFISE